MSAAILWTLNLPLGLPLGHIAFLSFRDRSKTRIKTALCYANGSWQTCVIVALTTVNFGYVRQDRPKMSMPGWEDCLAAQARAPAGGAVRSRTDRQEWLEAKHGAKSRRKWRKLHLAVDAASGMIVAQTLTDQDTDDTSQVDAAAGSD